jgi:IclR family KDG regulon transcriptional repressor
MSKLPKANIQSLERAFRILNCFTADRPQLRLAEISAMLNLNINTARGLATTLVALNYLQYDYNNYMYSLGLEFISKSNLILNIQVNQLKDTARPYLEEFANKYHTTCSLNLFSNAKMQTIDNVIHQTYNFFIGVPLYSVLPPFSASSKLAYAYSSKRYKEIMLSEYTEYINKNLEGQMHYYLQLLENETEKILKQGYADESSYAVKNFIKGILSYAFPIFRCGETLLGSISFTTTKEEFADEKKDLISEMKNLAQEISSSFK